MQLSDLAAATAAVTATRSRLTKTAALADVLRRADPLELPVVVAYLTGELPQRQIGVGWAALKELAPAAETPSLQVLDVDARLAAIGVTAGAGSQQRRREQLDALFGLATAEEQRFLHQLLLGELRQGAQVGVMTDAVASAAGLPLADVRRAAMLRGELGPVAVAALVDGAAGLAEFGLQVGRPLLPMLAQTAKDPAEAIAKVGRAAFDRKLDGARMQVHRDGSDIAVFSRTLDDITARVPEVVESVAALNVRSIVLDGEALALRPDGRPQPFQVTASRFGSRRDIAAAREVMALHPFYFDLLHLDGDDFIDQPTERRLQALGESVPIDAQVPRVITDDPYEAQRFLDGSLAAGHEGVVAKAIDAPYEAGRRGAGWMKIKPVHTLDLVVLAAEWGSGRRKGWLSNLHLGARDPKSGGFVMLGKTFKGLTDALLTWQTAQLLERAIGPTDAWVVPVRPELVVEIGFDGVQTSTRYPGGMALRFARVLRYRDDKSAAEADTVQTVREFHARAHD
ncbi:MAG: ligB [Jatrophihabitantaceae bacterium]|nr:ligB [Jatrophihabitantaceae bacterium]